MAVPAAGVSRTFHIEPFRFSIKRICTFRPKTGENPCKRSYIPSFGMPSERLDKGIHPRRSMQIKIRNGKDFYAGLFFFFVGLVTVFEARDYSVGTARSMGPGYFPILLGYLLLMIGAGAAVRGLWLKGEKIRIASLRPLLMVSGAVLSFAFLLKPCGLILALLALVFVSCLGSREFRLRDTVILYFALTTIATGLFVYALGLPLPLFWSN